MAAEGCGDTLSVNPRKTEQSCESQENDNSGAFYTGAELIYLQHENFLGTVEARGTSQLVNLAFPVVILVHDGYVVTFQAEKPSELRES